MDKSFVQIEELIFMYMYCRYPSSFIDNQFQQFFSEHIDPLSFLPYIIHKQKFLILL